MIGPKTPLKESQRYARDDASSMPTIQVLSPGAWHPDFKTQHTEGTGPVLANGREESGRENRGKEEMVMFTIVNLYMIDCHYHISY